MSGIVHVNGDASQAAGATGRGGLLVIDGNASARCGISMKGIDIVVKGTIGHMSAFMAQAGNLVVLGDAGEALGDSIYEARLFVRGRSRASAPTASRRRCATSIRRNCMPGWKRPASPGRVDVVGVPALRLGAHALPLPHRQRRRVLRGANHDLEQDPAHDAAQVGDLRRLHAVGDPPRRGDRHLRHPRRRRQAQAAAFRRPAVPRRLDHPLSARRLSRELRHRRGARHALRQEADRAEDPDHHRRHELRLAVGAGQGGARAAAPAMPAPRRPPATAA